jgi:hypothetical protein
MDKSLIFVFFSIEARMNWELLWGGCENENSEGGCENENSEKKQNCNVNMSKPSCHKIIWAFFEF